jgi:hypothetical protein
MNQFIFLEEIETTIDTSAGVVDTGNRQKILINANMIFKFTFNEYLKTGSLILSPEVNHPIHVVEDLATIFQKIYSL